MTGTGRDHAAEVAHALALLTGLAPLPIDLVRSDAVDGQRSSDLLPARRVSFLRLGDRPPQRWPGPDGSAGAVHAASPHHLVVGLGPQLDAGSSDAPPSEPWRVAGEAVGRCMDHDVLLDLPGCPEGSSAAGAGGGLDDEAAAALGCGLVVGALAAEPRGSTTQRAVLPLDASQEVLAAARRGASEGVAVHLARLLVCAPPGVATPARIAAWAREGASAVGAQCEVLDAGALAAAGWGGVLAVGSGSREAPHVVRLRWDGRGAASGVQRADLAVVGKGVTFDSGGLSLKDPVAMQSMRMDCAGAAVALAAVLSLAARHAPVVVEAVLPLAENMPGPGATRPGDVVSTLSGRQVQVLDTDFEGRVLLADALTAACSGDAPPRLLVDVATLTHQAVVALGQDVGALLARDDTTADRVLGAARRAGEPLWRLPLSERYRPQVDLGWAVRNHPLHDFGRATTAALFLGEFVASGQAWAHLDVAGPSWRGDASGDGATGFGVRTLLELARSMEGGRVS